MYTVRRSQRNGSHLNPNNMMLCLKWQVTESRMRLLMSRSTVVKDPRCVLVGVERRRLGILTSSVVRVELTPNRSQPSIYRAQT